MEVYVITRTLDVFHDTKFFEVVGVYTHELYAKQKLDEFVKYGQIYETFELEPWPLNEGPTSTGTVTATEYP